MGDLFSGGLIFGAIIGILRYSTVFTSTFLGGDCCIEIILAIVKELQ